MTRHDTIRVSTLPSRTFTAPLSLVALAFAAGCGGDPKPARGAGDLRDDRPGFRPYRDNVQATSEIGALHEEKTADAFKEALPGLQQCLNEGASRIEFISGEIAFFIKVNAAAKIEHVHAEESSLGDRETERCMFDVLRKADWPKPYGGDVGIARNSFQFDMHDVRPPTDWDSERVDTGLEPLGDELQDCKAGYSGEFTATMYVGTSGEVIGVSVTPPNEEGEGAVDCLVAALQKGEFERSGSWPAKVRFRL